MELENNVVLDYNTDRKKLAMPEYGRNVLRMVQQVKEIADRDKRSEQARAIVKVMSLLNPQVHAEDNWEQKLWDHLFIMAEYDLDVDSPYPMPDPVPMQDRPVEIPLKKKPVKATHYGRNIESIIDLIASEPDGDRKTAMLKSLAIYMRQQYLIWNKDSVADETIFQDIEKLSDYRIKVPEGMTLSKVSSDMTYSRPGLNLDFGGQRKQGGQMMRKNFQKKGGKR